MNKKFLPIISIMAAMALVGCTKKTSSSVEPSSEAPVSESATPSSVAPSSQTPAPSSQTPTPSSETPVSSSEAPVSSEESSVSVSVFPTTSKSMGITNVDLRKADDGKIYAIIKGTTTDFTGTVNAALGLEHATIVDGKEGFVVGKYEPATADYNIPVTIGEGGAYQVEIEVKNLSAGCYYVYFGAQDAYNVFSATKADTRVKSERYAFNYRNDAEVQNKITLLVDQLPPIAMEEALPVKDGDDIYFRIGGSKLDFFNQSEVEAFEPFFRLQNVDNWGYENFTSEDFRWNFSVEGKAYFEVKVTRLISAELPWTASNPWGGGGNTYNEYHFNTHLNMAHPETQDCKMDTVIHDSYIYNGRIIEVFSEPTTGLDGDKGYWGNLGWRIKLAPEGAQEGKHTDEYVYGDPVTAEGESEYKVGVCATDGRKQILIDAGKNITSNMNRGGKLPKDKATNKVYDGSNPVTYKFTTDQDFRGHLKAKVSVDQDANCSQANGYSYYTGKNGGSSAIKVLPDGKTNTSLKVNGVDVVMPTTTYYDMGIRGTNEASAGIADFGFFELKKGTQELTLAGLDSYGLNYYEFYFEAC